eukprot:CAMPEP_0179216290 /NCGR_PEP_ID=MMETSP0797-20121207/3301_1 /TAXON_ID=47934 /ORGANISM="Dinophysis acuminata, Strain DAEP01" /LENGTH=61 /DNA_ID=CAMNT_0020922441 /DNA_START=223 /DNA_END=408 /DNA_ORIENTATION=+
MRRLVLADLGARSEVDDRVRVALVLREAFARVAGRHIAEDFLLLARREVEPPPAPVELLAR